MAAVPEGSPFEIEDVAAEIQEKRIVAELLAGYRNYLEHQLTSLRDAVEDADRSEIHRVAHAIRSGALTVGASALARAAENLEKVIWEIDSRAIGDHLAEVAARTGELSDLSGGFGVGAGD